MGFIQSAWEVNHAWEGLPVEGKEMKAVDSDTQVESGEQ